MNRENIFTVGGTVQASNGLYIPRGVDAELLALCRKGTFAYVLTPRQLGKSSLMVRTAEQLTKEGVRSVIIDLTQIGVQVTPEEWYVGLVSMIEEQLSLTTDTLVWWREHAHLGVTQRLTRFFEEVLLVEVTTPVVVFVDEIDTTLSLNFTDDFFGAIRYFYNARALSQDVCRLSFVLIGVATPGDLIRDPQRTPFNIGHPVHLTDFTLEEALPLTTGFSLPDSEARAVLGWAMKWTGGHPYLTQRLCRVLADQGLSKWSESEVDQTVASTFFGENSKQDSNLDFVRDMLTERVPEWVEISEVISTYRDVRRGKLVTDEEHSLIKSHIKLSGLVRSDNGRLRVRNRIYEQVFDEDWIKQHLPGTYLRKRLRRVAVIAATFGVIALAFALIAAYAVRTRAEAIAQKQEAVEQRQEALRQQQIAVAAQENADTQRRIAEHRLVEAEAAQKRELIARQEADKATKAALKAAAGERAARKRADDAARNAQANLDSLNQSLSRSATNVQAILTFQRGDYSRALELFNYALEKLDREEQQPAADEITTYGRHFSRMGLLLSKGATLRKLTAVDGNNLRDAVKAYQHAETLWKEYSTWAMRQGGTKSDDDHLTEFDIHFGLAKAQEELGNIVRDNPKLSRAASVGKPADNNPKRAPVTSVIESEDTDYNQSEKNYKEALSRAELLSPNSSASLVTVHEGMARFYIGKGRDEEVENFYQKVKSSRQRLPEMPEYQETLNEMSLYYRGRAKYDVAALLYEELATLMEKKLRDNRSLDQKEAISLIQAYTDLGLTYQLGGALYKAGVSFEMVELLRSLFLEQRQVDAKGERSNMGSILNQVGDKYAQLEKYDIAESQYLLALNYASPTHRSFEETLRNLAILYEERLQNFPKAEQYYQSLISHYEKQPKAFGEGVSTPGYNLTVALESLGKLYADKMNRLDDAATMFQRASAASSEFDRDSTFEIETRLANVYRRGKKTQELIETNQKRLRLAGEEMRRPLDYFKSDGTDKLLDKDITFTYQTAASRQISAFNDLVESLRAAGRVADADAAFKQLAESSELVFDYIKDLNLLESYSRVFEDYRDSLRSRNRSSEAAIADQRITKIKVRQDQLKQVGKP